jgi:putative ABC transport system permease protein
MPCVLRHGIANLYRPGNHAGAVLVALGVGVMFTLTVFLVQRSMAEAVLSGVPRGMPNVLLINITEKERAGLVELLKKQPGVRHPPAVIASAAAQLTSVNGVPVQKLPLAGPGRRFRGTRIVTWFAEKPPDTEIVQGAWWPAGKRTAEPQVSVAEDAAKILSVQPGSRLEWAASGHSLAARVACVHRTETARPGGDIEFMFSPSDLRGLPVMYYGGVRVESRAVPALQRAAYERYPTVTVINIADVLDIVQDIVDEVAGVARFVAAFVILAGAIILASSVAGTRFRRIRETAILKTLGATRRRVAGIFSVEFLILGGTAGILGGLLATAFSALLLKRLFDAELRFDPWPVLLAAAFTALIANLAGWLASIRILAKKPLEVLRQE